MRKYIDWLGSFIFACAIIMMIIVGAIGVEYFAERMLAVIFK